MPLTNTTTTSITLLNQTINPKTQNNYIFSKNNLSFPILIYNSITPQNNTPPKTQKKKKINSITIIYLPLFPSIIH